MAGGSVFGTVKSQTDQASEQQLQKAKSRVDDRAQIIIQAQPRFLQILQSAPQPVREAFENTETRAATLGLTLTAKSKAIADSLVQRGTKEWDRTHEFLEVNLSEVQTLYFGAVVQATATLYVENARTPDARAYLTVGRNYENIGVAEGLCASGDIPKAIAAEGEKQQKGWVKENGEELINHMINAGYSGEVALSVARDLDKKYKTNLADTFIVQNPANFNSVVQNTAFQVLRLEELIKRMERTEKGKEEEIKKLEEKRDFELARLRKFVGEKNEGSVPKLLAKSSEMDTLIRQIIAQTEREIQKNSKAPSKMA